MKKYLIEILIIVIISASYGFAAYQRNIIWKNDLSLWKDVVKKSPDKARVYNAIGMYYYTRQRHGEAIPFFQRSLSLQPGYAFGYNNLGLCLLGKGRINEAIEAFKRAIKAKPFRGMYHVNLGIAYWKKGLHKQAKKEIQIGKDLRRKPQTK